jgi:hypothetical protein
MQTDRTGETLTPLVPLGDAAAAVCTDGVCEVPQAEAEESER